MAHDGIDAKAATVEQDRRIGKLELTVDGERDDGVAAKVATLWAIDRVKLWAARILVGGPFP